MSKGGAEWQPVKMHLHCNTLSMVPRFADALICITPCVLHKESIYRVAKTHRIPYLYRSFFRKSDIYSMALLWKIICNLGDPMSLRHPVERYVRVNVSIYHSLFCHRARCLSCGCLRAICLVTRNQYWRRHWAYH